MPASPPAARAWAWLAARPWRLALAVAVLALALRAPALDRSLWLDEAVSMQFSALEPGEITEWLREYDNHPPGWYLTLRGWRGLVATDPGARLLPLLLSLAHVVVLGLVARRLLGPAGAFAAAALAAVAPDLVWPGYELRSFAMAALLSSLGWLCTLVALERGGWWRWALASLALAGSLWTFYYAALVGPALAAFVLLRRPGRARLAGFALAGLAAAACFAPWLAVMSDQMERVREAAAVQHGLERSLHGVLYAWLYQHLVRIAPWHLVAGAALAVALVVRLRRRPGPLWADAQAEPGARAALRPLLGLALVYLLAVLAVGLAGSFVHRKYAGFLAGAWCVLGAALWLRLDARLRPLALTVVLCAGAGVSFAKTLTAERAPWRDAAAWLAAAAGPDDALAIVPSYESVTAHHYLPARVKVLGLPWDLAPTWLPRQCRPQRIPELTPRLELWLGRHDALWLVLAGESDRPQVDVPRRQLTDTLARQGWKRTREHAVGRLRFERWTR